MNIGMKIREKLDHKTGLRAAHFLAGGCGAVYVWRKLQKWQRQRKPVHFSDIPEQAGYLRRRFRQMKSGLRVYDAGVRITATVFRELSRRER